MLFIKALQRQQQAIRNHPVAFLLLLIIAGVILYEAYAANSWLHPIGYLAAMWICALVTDLFTINSKPKELPVRKPLRETTFALVFIALGIAGLWLRFVALDWEAIPGILRLVIVGFMFLGAMQIGMAIMLLLSKYKLGELGFRISPLILLCLPIIGITALTAYLVGTSFTFAKILEEVGGIGGMLVSGLIMAALPEEFMRMVLQTRLGVLLNNKATGWFIACLLWALLHVPKWYGDGDIIGAVLGAVNIMPIGLMWSYIIHRTKNILPSILVHGFNGWGLQNLQL